MRLSKVRLAGFKSFVDPITVAFPGDLIGVVGPNGCGKSNIIDAIMWVMGESSARHLRGDSMADVIFDGATSRKPVGQATVELVFDNSDGQVGGQYAGYSEISIRRQISRDGLSLYYLNNARCRRRDIVDIFLGTGFGPRSYSIIGQGMISRIIEARPEELRVFLEEAAGISKYKERRRETENRIRHTRDNISRINDIIDELAKQLEKLDRQAKAAERYQGLKQEERLASARLLAVTWRGLNEAVDRHAAQIGARENAVEAAVAGQREVEASIEHQRSGRTEASEAFTEAQSAFYTVGAEISRTEQAIQHTREQRQRLEDEHDKARRDWEEVNASLQTDQHELAALNETLMAVEPDLGEARATESMTLDGLQAAEKEMQAWQSVWDEFNERGSTLLQAAEVQRTRIEHLEQRTLQRQARIEKLRQEHGRLQPGSVEDDIAALQGELAEAESQQQQCQAEISTLQGRIRDLREENRQSGADLDEARTEAQDIRGRLASLQALQKAALGQQQEGVVAWLQARRLADRPRLAQAVTVATGWESALETVLGFHLESVCVEGLETGIEALAELAEGELSLHDISASLEPDRQGGVDAPYLADKVRADWPLDGVLSGIHVADDLDTALALRAGLRAGESIVTRDGVWIGRQWLRVVRGTDEHAGVISRERDIKQGQERVRQLDVRIEELVTGLDQGRERLHELEDELDDTRRTQEELQRRIAQHQATLGSRQQQMEQMQARAGQLGLELEELGNEQAEDTDSLASARGILQQAIEQTDRHERERAALASARQAHEDKLEELRGQWQEAREKSQHFAVQQASRLSQRTSLEQALQRLRGHLDQLAARKQELSRELAECEAPFASMQQGLEALLQRRVQAEQKLNGARHAVEAVDEALRGLEQRRGECEQSVQDLRDVLEQARMDGKETVVRRQTVQEQLDDSGLERDEILAELPPAADKQALQEELDGLDRKIRRLGAINLAAIDEFSQLSERKEYLDAQYADLTEALTTLEHAISKIDRETRTRFKETFDKVNDGLKEMFPRLFGGGHAYLEMTSDDLLSTGVAVMARPPGKRNSTIHLLSGGEKALTAIAMVFSLFQLNPAPVCLLDEVDAPLDDTNVERFSKMVQSMSSQVQFVFITHNKITMEIAQQLIGVTMHEPGVSRLVTVDIDEAVDMVAV